MGDTLRQSVMFLLVAMDQLSASDVRVVAVSNTGERLESEIHLFQSGRTVQNTLAGLNHDGYTGNYRQNGLTWSMQINTGTDSNGDPIVQIDIDPYNPASAPPIGAITHGILQVVPNHLTGSDTNYTKAANALKKRGVNVGKPCTGGN